MSVSLSQLQIETCSTNNAMCFSGANNVNIYEVGNEMKRI